MYRSKALRYSAYNIKYSTSWLTIEIALLIKFVSFPLTLSQSVFKSNSLMLYLVPVNIGKTLSIYSRFFDMISDSWACSEFRFTILYGGCRACFFIFFYFFLFFHFFWRILHAVSVLSRFSQVLLMVSLVSLKTLLCLWLFADYFQTLQDFQMLHQDISAILKCSL